MAARSFSLFLSRRRQTLICLLLPAETEREREKKSIKAHYARRAYHSERSLAYKHNVSLLFHYYYYSVSDDDYARQHRQSPHVHLNSSVTVPRHDRREDILPVASAQGDRGNGHPRRGREDTRAGIEVSRKS